MAESAKNTSSPECAPHVGESQPRHPNMKTESKILNMISSRQAQAHNQSAEQSVTVVHPPRPEGTMRQLSLPVAPTGLSATAAEFVPQSHSIQSQAYSAYADPAVVYAEGQDGNYIYNNPESLQYVDYYIGNNFGDLTLEDSYDAVDQPYYNADYSHASIEERFEFALKILTTNPSNVEEYLKPICSDIVSRNAYNSVASNIVENLYKQCIMEENFRYIGARICQYLNSSLNPEFIKRFVKRCQKDFEQRDQLLQGSQQDKKRIQGLGMLLAEIFRNVETAGSDGSPERLSFLPSILIKTVDTLLSVPNDANVKCACQLLKLSGSLIEDVVKSNPEDCIHFEGLFDTLRNLLKSSQMSENANFHVERLVELKDNSWNTALPPQSSTNIFNPYAAHNQGGGAMGGFPLVPDQDAVYFDQLSKDSDDSVSHLLTEEEEADFLAWQFDGYKQDPGMGNEMEEAYEEFLRQQQPPPPPPPQQQQQHYNYQMPPQHQDRYRFTHTVTNQVTNNHYHRNYYQPPENQYPPEPHRQQFDYNQHQVQPQYLHYNNPNQQLQQQHQHHHHHHQHHQHQHQQQQQQPRYPNQNPSQGDPYHYNKRC